MPLSADLKFPSHFDSKAQDLIRKLLQPEVSKRLGTLKGGPTDIRKHKWFKGIDFKKLLERKVKPKIVPNVSGDGDASNFDEYPDEEAPAAPVAAEMLEKLDAMFVGF